MRFEYKEIVVTNDSRGETKGFVEDLDTNEIIVSSDTTKGKKFLNVVVKLINEKFEEDEYYSYLF